MLMNIDSSTWIALIGIILLAFAEFCILKLRLLKERREHEETREASIVLRELLHLLKTASIPDSTSNVRAVIEKFWALIPYGELELFALTHYRAEIDRIRYQCNARDALDYLRRMYQYVKQPSECIGDELIEIDKKLGVYGGSLVRTAERAMEELQESLQKGGWSNASIGTSEREICEMLTVIIRSSGEEVRKRTQTDLRNLRKEVIHLSEMTGNNFSPLLETVLEPSRVESETDSVLDKASGG